MTGALTLGAMAFLAAALVLLPLIRGAGRRQSRAAFDRAVYRDQLGEIERDLERGVIGGAEAEAARAEVARKLLAADREVQAEAATSHGIRPSRSRLGEVLIVAVAAAIPAGAAGLYLALGAPGIPGQPFAERRERGDAPQAMTAERLASIVAMIESRLRQAPDELTGWKLLTTAYLRLGRDADAERALARAEALMLTGGDTAAAAVLQVDFAEALMARAGGQLPPRALAAVERALELVPDHPAARYYLGLARLQAGDGRGALDIWAKLAREAPADAPWLPTLRQRIERLAAERGLDPARFLPPRESGAGPAPGPEAAPGR